MNKTRLVLLILGSSLVVVGLTSLIIWQYMSSFHNLDVVIPSDLDASVYKVVDGKNQTVKSVKGSTTLSLQAGDYCITLTDTKYDPEPVCALLGSNDASVSLDPHFSASYLASQLTSELESQLHLIISQKYSAIIDGYIFGKGKLLGDGSWYATTLTTKVAPSDRGDYYRVLLEKDGDSWQIIAFPQLALSKYDYPNVPVEVLGEANKLLGSY